MLKPLRQHITKTLWERYCLTSPDMQRIHATLTAQGITERPLDHFAIIDLPSPISGIPILSELFTLLGYRHQGSGYLPDKQNDFAWLTEEDAEGKLAKDVLPQVVVADFRLDELPPNVRAIIEKYTKHTKEAPLNQVKTALAQKEPAAIEQCAALILHYLSGRDWPMPTLNEYLQVKEFNELLAWVLVFGRKANHFTLSIHLLQPFTSLPHFHRFIEHDASLSLNHEGGIIKGSKETGIEQGSTKGISKDIMLADQPIQMPTGFVEFVWRFAERKPQHEAILWQDFFTGFVANHANKVIESLCVKDSGTIQDNKAAPV